MKKLYVLAALVCGLLVGRIFAGDSVNAPQGFSNSINADYGGVDIVLSSFTINVTTVGLPGDYGRPGSFNAYAATGPSMPSGQFGFMASTTTPNNKTQWRVYGAYFSTGNCGAGDFIDIFTSPLGFSSVNQNNPLRIYNNLGSTVAATSSVNASGCTGFTFLRWPIRMYGNLYFRASAATYNNVGLLYWKEGD